jgi:hypothetical protein
MILTMVVEFYSSSYRRIYPTYLIVYIMNYIVVCSKGREVLVRGLILKVK